MIKHKKSVGDRSTCATATYSQGGVRDEGWKGVWRHVTEDLESHSTESAFHLLKHIRG